MGRFKNCNFRTDVGTWCDTNTTDLSCQSIRQVVAIKVQSRNRTVLSRPQKDLLQHGIRDHIFNHDVIASLWILHCAPRTAVKEGCAKLFTSEFITPIFKRTFSEFHDVTLVDQRHTRQIIINRILQCLTDKPLRTLFRYRLDTNTAVFWETNFRDSKFVAKDINQFFRFWRSCLILDSRVDIFRVLTKNHHVGFFWLFQRTWNTREITHRTQTKI